MSLLLYINEWQEGEASLTETLSQAVSGESWETCRNPAQLAGTISRPGREWGAVVAAVGAPAALHELEPFKDQLSRLGLLLILPSQDKSLVAMGYRLAPRLLVGGEDAPAVIAQVLEQMMRNRECKALKTASLHLG